MEYNKELEELINAALEDSVLTDNEKRVLTQKAQAMGVNPDEFTIMLEARLIKEQKRKKRKTIASVILIIGIVITLLLEFFIWRSNWWFIGKWVMALIVLTIPIILLAMFNNVSKDPSTLFNLEGVFALFKNNDNE